MLISCLFLISPCFFLLSVVLLKKAPMTVAMRSWSYMIRTLGDGRSSLGRWAKNAKHTRCVVCYCRGKGLDHWRRVILGLLFVHLVCFVDFMGFGSFLGLFGHLFLLI